MTSLLGNMGADWLLKRAFKFLLKKNLGSLLQNEVCKAHTPLWPALNCHNPQSWLCARVLPSDIARSASYTGATCGLDSRMPHMMPMQVQVDLDMLNVSLGTGTLEVHSALLNTAYIDAQLVRSYL
jgi:hypothetical protein